MVKAKIIFVNTLGLEKAFAFLIRFDNLSKTVQFKFFTVEDIVQQGQSFC